MINRVSEKQLVHCRLVLMISFFAFQIVKVPMVRPCVQSSTVQAQKLSIAASMFSLISPVHFHQYQHHIDITIPPCFSRSCLHLSISTASISPLFLPLYFYCQCIHCIHCNHSNHYNDCNICNICNECNKIEI